MTLCSVTLRLMSRVGSQLSQKSSPDSTVKAKHSVMFFMLSSTTFWVLAVDGSIERVDMGGKKEGRGGKEDL